MKTPEITIVVTPRERFSHSLEALDCLYRHTTVPFHLVYVAVAYPAPLAGQLREQAAVRGFELIRVEQHISSNQARNLASAKVETPYVVYIENDVLVSPGWLENLLACAAETGAAIVSPVYQEGAPEAGIIHLAGGECRVEQRADGRHFSEKHLFARRHLDDVLPTLTRGETELFEFHCVLMRTEVVKQLGPFDEALKSIAEHADFALLTRQAGERIMIEPTSVVTYDFSQPLDRGDLSFFRQRWSARWNRASIDHFSAKWRLVRDNALYADTLLWATLHRQTITLGSHPVRSVIGRPLSRLLIRALRRWGGWRLRRNLARLSAQAARVAG
jgi:GT2 family glycosyltransferase